MTQTRNHVPPHVLRIDTVHVDICTSQQLPVAACWTGLTLSSLTFFDTHCSGLYSLDACLDEAYPQPSPSIRIPSMRIADLS